MVIDPHKPDVLYVAMLQRRRAVGQLIGGGPESGLYKIDQCRKDLDQAFGRVADGRTGPHRARPQLEKA